MPKNSTPYNPLEKRQLAESVTKALLNQPVGPLLPVKEFEGAGAYGIYYTGDFELYRPVAVANRNGKFGLPIYVGKAVPKGSRKGGFGLGAAPGKALYRRLVEHAESVEQSKNLRLKDFTCRHLVVDDIWIPLGESLLIEMFAPVWNRCLDGFGNHDPGVPRSGQQRSAWDVLHPGRPWAAKLGTHKRSQTEIEQMVQTYLRDNPAPAAS